MKIKPPKEGLSEDQEMELWTSIVDFANWLIERKIIKHIPHIVFEDMPYSDADWMMKYDSKRGTLSFNTFKSKDCSYEYFRSIVLHEFFHLAVQKVPNKEDATRIKDDFGEELMKLIDIEADFFTALFHKEKYGFGLVQYLKLYYEGTQVFSDKWIRVSKLERYIGTLLSICKMFISHHNDNKTIRTYDLYLVSISPFFTEDTLHVLVIRKEHIYFDLIQASMNDFNKIKDCYTNIDGISFKAYVSKIINFVSKALPIGIPQNLEEEILHL